MCVGVFLCVCGKTQNSPTLNLDQAREGAVVDVILHDDKTVEFVVTQKMAGLAGLGMSRNAQKADKATVDIPPGFLVNGATTRGARQQQQQREVWGCVGVYGQTSAVKLLKVLPPDKTVAEGGGAASAATAGGGAGTGAGGGGLNAPPPSSKDMMNLPVVRTEKDKHMKTKNNSTQYNTHFSFLAHLNLQQKRSPRTN